MATSSLPVRSDLKSYDFEVDLEGKIYKLVFNYRRRIDRWVMHVEDNAGVELINGIVLHTAFIVNGRYVDTAYPPGEMITYDETRQNKEAGEGDLGNDVKLFYTESE